MLKPKTSPTTRRFWDDLTDEQLLDRELTTDSPATLPGLVHEIPAGDEEPHVEFKYDLSGIEGADQVCIHGHHRHRKGFVFKKGDARFLVGWMCGKTLYGADFDKFTADYDAAVTRRDALVRVRDFRNAISGFASWLDQINSSSVIEDFDYVRGTILHKMPAVAEVVGTSGEKVRDVSMPRGLFDGGHVSGEMQRLMTDTASIATSLTGDPIKVAASIGAIRTNIDSLIRRAENVLRRFSAVEDLFQPVTLAAICEEIANAVPQRRKHFPGLLRITSKNVCVEMPKGYRVPSRQPLDSLIAVVAS